MNSATFLEFRVTWDGSVSAGTFTIALCFTSNLKDFDDWKLKFKKHN